MNPTQSTTLPAGITCHDGLLWRGDTFLNCPEADAIAQSLGFLYVERLIHAMAEKAKEPRGSWACSCFKVSDEDPSFCANCGDLASMHEGPTPGAPRSFRL